MVCTNHVYILNLGIGTIALPNIVLLLIIAHQICGFCMKQMDIT